MEQQCGAVVWSSSAEQQCGAAVWRSSRLDDSTAAMRTASFSFNVGKEYGMHRYHNVALTITYFLDPYDSQKMISYRNAIVKYDITHFLDPQDSQKMIPYKK